MTIDTTLEQLRTQLARDLMADRETQTPFDPTPFDIHVASSGLQKGIRRGDVDTALRSTARLMEDDPSRFWRRLIVIVFEDVGLGDLSLVGLVTAASGQKRWRAGHGGEWFVASHLVKRICEANKDRTADDLLHLVEFDDRLTDHRKCWGHADIDRLTDFLGQGDVTLPQKALAAWLGVGTARWRSSVLVNRQGFPENVFDRFRDLGADPTLVDICQAGLGKMAYALPAFLPLIQLASRSKTPKPVSDQFPHEAYINGMPVSVFDGYTRHGKQSIKTLLNQSDCLRGFLTGKAPESKWSKIVALILFRIEGGLMAQRLRWKLGNRIVTDADMCGRDIDLEAVPEAMNILRDELPRLNAIRAHISASVGE